MRVLLILLALTSAAFAQQQQLQPQKNFTLTLTESQINVIWAGLLELPGKAADPVKTEIVKQIEATAKKPPELKDQKK